MRTDLIDIIDTLAVVDGTVYVKPLAPSERDGLDSKVVWTYCDQRAPETVIHFGDTAFRPKDGRKSVVVDTGGPQYDYEIKAILLLLHHVGTREGATPYKWLTVTNRVRTLMRLARYCLARGHQSFRDLGGLQAVKRKRLATTVIDDGEKRHQSGAHHFRFDGHHCDRARSQAG